MRWKDALDSADAKRGILQALAVASGISIAFGGKSNIYDEWVRVLERLQDSNRDTSAVSIAMLNALLPVKE